MSDGTDEGGYCSCHSGVSMRLLLQNLKPTFCPTIAFAHVWVDSLHPSFLHSLESAFAEDIAFGEIDGSTILVESNAAAAFHEDDSDEEAYRADEDRADDDKDRDEDEEQSR